MNLLNLVWDFTTSYEQRANEIDFEISEMERRNFQDFNGLLLKGTRPLTFDIYYNFSEDLDKVKNWSKRWKQLKLAREVLRVIKNWDKKYLIDLNKKVSGKEFIAFFSDKINTSKHYLCSLGINTYKYAETSFKRFVLWADKLHKLGIIGHNLYNNFLSWLEGASNGKSL